MEDLPRYTELCINRTDISEHLPILSRYASKCSSILEAGVRSVVSTWAFVNGLRRSDTSDKVIYSVDIEDAPIGEVRDVAGKYDIVIKFTMSDILKFELPQDVDITFIDTFHCYGQLKRELDLFADKTKRYIIMHDTTVDGIKSEAIRLKYNISEYCRRLGWTEHEVCTGLWPAVQEFLAANPNWKLHHRFVNNNGLTILKRIK